MKNLKHNTTSIVNINYHIIWYPKYRRSVLVGGVETRLKELLPELTEESGRIIENRVPSPEKKVALPLDKELLLRNNRGYK